MTCFQYIVARPGALARGGCDAIPIERLFARGDFHLLRLSFSLPVPLCAQSYCIMTRCLLPGTHTCTLMHTTHRTTERATHTWHSRVRAAHAPRSRPRSSATCSFFSLLALPHETTTRRVTSFITRRPSARRHSGRESSIRSDTSSTPCVSGCGRPFSLTFSASAAEKWTQFLSKTW